LAGCSRQVRSQAGRYVAGRKEVGGSVVVQVAAVKVVHGTGGMVKA